MDKQFIFNLETTKIELHFEKSEYDELTDGQKQALKSAFLWSRAKGCWVSRAKEPHLWRAKEVAKSLGFTSEQRGGERLTFAEQVERKAERAEARADRYEGYAGSAERRAESLQKPINDMHGDIAFFTQPNINTSSGRAFTRRRERMFEQYRQGFDEYRKSEYFKEKAAALRSEASGTKYKDRAYLDRRIKECEKDIRKREKNVTHYEELIYALENGEIKKKLNGDVITINEVQEWLDHELELIEVTMDKQAFLENCLDDIGGLKYNKDNIKVGYVVTVDRFGKVEVISTGPVNFTYKTMRGSVLMGAYAEILDIVSMEERKTEGQPFSVGEQFVARVYSSKERNFIKLIYKIVKATASTIKLKSFFEGDIPTEDKEITRKPKVNYNGKWQFSIDGTYANTFVKEC